MSFLVRCDNCARVQETEVSNTGDPVNPMCSETGRRWWSRTIRVDGKYETVHACSEDCMRALGGPVRPY